MPVGPIATMRGLRLPSLLLGLICLLAAGSARAQAAGALAAQTQSGGPQELAGSARAAAAGATPDGAQSGLADPPALIQFPPGSAALTPSATRLLDRLGRMLAEPDHVWLEGHSDGGGDGRDLAARRAEAVAAYLEQNCGVSPDKVGWSASMRMPRREVTIRIVGD